MDIFPTILSLFEEPVAPYDCDGISLIKHITGLPYEDENRIITSENEGQVATIYRDGTLKIRKKEYPSEPKMLYIPDLIESLDDITYNLDFAGSIQGD